MNLFPRRDRGRLLNFHRPHRLGIKHPLKPESIDCLRNLSAYKRPKARGRYPRSRSAAVLVALFVGRGGDLYVLLSRRSDKLRSYPGDTSLPGGKLERIDRSVENAARREAFEEIGLPLDKTKVPLLCILEPFLAGNHIIVTPVVVLITDQTLRPILNAYEVQSIFSHPLLGFLTTEPVREPEPGGSEAPLRDGENDPNNVPPQVAHPGTITTPVSAPPPLPSLPFQYPQGFPPSTPMSSTRPSSGSVPATYALKPQGRPYHTYRDSLWHGSPVRMHSFLTGRETEGVKPISGLTSAILIRTAQIGYAREPAFALHASEQRSLDDRIATAIQEDESLRTACRKEGIERDWISQADDAVQPQEREEKEVRKSQNLLGKQKHAERGRL